MVRYNSSYSDAMCPRTLTAAYNAYDLNIGSGGAQYRRDGPPELQQTHHFPGGQSATYGDYDDLPEYSGNDPFISQLDEVDAHRRALERARSVTCNVQQHRDSYDTISQTGIGFARIYFGAPVPREYNNTSDNAGILSPRDSVIDQRSSANFSDQSEHHICLQDADRNHGGNDNKQDSFHLNPAVAAFSIDSTGSDLFDSDDPAESPDLAAIAQDAVTVCSDSKDGLAAGIEDSPAQQSSELSISVFTGRRQSLIKRRELPVLAESAEEG